MANYEQMVSQIPRLRRWMASLSWLNCNVPSPVVEYWWGEYLKSWAARVSGDAPDEEKNVSDQ